MQGWRIWGRWAWSAQHEPRWEGFWITDGADRYWVSAAGVKEPEVNPDYEIELPTALAETIMDAGAVLKAMVSGTYGPELREGAGHSLPIPE